MSQEQQPSRTQFLLKNLLRGVLILGAFLVAFVLFRKYGGADYLTWLDPISNRPSLVFLIYSLSEVFFGIITPEIFMGWALKQGDGYTYMKILAALALISYGAGWLNFIAGKRFGKVTWVKNYIDNKLGKYKKQLDRYGGFLVIVAAVTPLPFSAICLLVGSVDYPAKRFFLFSLFRLGRYALYGYSVWGVSFF